MSPRNVALRATGSADRSRMALLTMTRAKSRMASATKPNPPATALGPTLESRGPPPAAGHHLTWLAGRETAPQYPQNQRASDEWRSQAQASEAQPLQLSVLDPAKQSPKRAAAHHRYRISPVGSTDQAEGYFIPPQPDSCSPTSRRRETDALRQPGQVEEGGPLLRLGASYRAASEVRRPRRMVLEGKRIEKNQASDQARQREKAYLGKEFSVGR